MKYLLILLFLSANTKQVLAQALTYQDGSPAKEIKLVNVEGSELLYPNWRLGSAKIASGVIYSNLSLKYNLYDDQVYFLGKDSISMKFINPVNEFHIEKDMFKNGYPAVKTFNNLSYYLIMAEGKATLLKKLTKNIIEVKEFNSSVTTKKIMDDKIYFLLVDGKITQVKNDKNSFISILADKKNEIDSYLKTNKVNFKKDEDLTALIKFYNDLK
ncbi:hypothetical protein [Pedobacter rhodius]|uniref:Uncharacterized protein n=1 Tax=Pedobacter rhodius TaxID=3004098 RepID=A0ABT4KYK1_9SPHI|nr:hypothetical protein [Pedobacter sp. SJ11]MCZ4224013.1 hypothetical protein [Pedobacter sp. SJ11]